jgi:predicted RNA-binding protein YlxR (DUF448 family)
LAQAVLAAAASEAPSGPNRRCLVTGAVRPKAELLRFVLDPNGEIVPDIAGKLPGRGLWLTARRDIVMEAASKRVFARAAKAPAVVSGGLEDRVAALLVQRCIEILGLARRSGLAVAGFERVREAVAARRASVLVEAMDGAAQGRGKIAALLPEVPRVACLSARELGVAFGREQAVHVALGKGRLAELFIVEARRLQGFRADVKVEVSER